MKSLDFLGDIAGDLAKVEEHLKETVSSRDPLLNQASLHPLEAGGKRLRPAMLLMAGRLFDYDLETLKPLAAGAELMHMATLVHDDVIDNSSLRRGRPTVNAAWSSKVAVLVGDYLFASAVASIASRYSSEVVRILADLVVEICHGEMLQTRHGYDLDLTEDGYLQRIQEKTASFFGVCTRLGALLCGASPEQVDALRRYGDSVGIAFQMADDLLDILGSAAETGKPVAGGDMRSGVYTLPLLYALKHSPRADRLREILSGDADDSAIGEALEIIKASGGVDYTRRQAIRYVDEAKAALTVVPESRGRKALEGLADFVVSRTW